MKLFEPEVRKTVYFVRHGQSRDNAGPVFQADDSPLSDVGLEQARRIAERISHLSFETLISSPFMRAKETATEIEHRTGIHPEYSELFIERRKPSSLQGKSYTDNAALELWQRSNETLYTAGTRVEDGENYEDIVSRVDHALEYLQAREESNIVVVTHGFFLRSVVARALFGDALTVEIFRCMRHLAIMQNTGLTILKYQNDFEQQYGWRLWIYNDHAHLAE